MDDPALMGVMDRERQALHQLRGRARVLRHPRELLAQAPAVGVFQGEKTLPFVFADLVDLNDVRMLKPRGRFGLGTEPRRDLRVIVDPGPDHFESDQPVQSMLTRDGTPPPSRPAEFLQQFVTRDARPEIGRGRRRARSGSSQVARSAAGSASWSDSCRCKRGQLGEATGEHRRIGRFVERLLEQIFAVNEFEDGVIVGFQFGITRQVRLDRNAFAPSPALHLIGAEAVDQFRRSRTLAFTRAEKPGDNRSVKGFILAALVHR